jgi:anti-sigma regulatory factor (Ser/Thr protein kinase)
MASPRLRFSLAVDAGQLEGSRERLRVFLQGHGIDEEAARDVLLCVHEACANAIMHSASTTGVVVELHLEEASVLIVVADHGLGLDLNLHDPHRKPELLQADGRGLYVMACLMDEFEVHVGDGTEIRMSKRLPRDTLARASREGRLRD